MGMNEERIWHDTRMGAWVWHDDGITIDIDMIDRYMIDGMTMMDG